MAVSNAISREASRATSTAPRRSDREARPMTRRPATGPRRAVVVTGMGLLTALGTDVGRRGRAASPAVRRRDDRAVRSRRGQRQIAGEVRTSTPSTSSTQGHARTDRYIQFGLVARARRWTRPACRPLEGEEAERTGVILGTGLGGVGTLSRASRSNATRGPDRISPFFIPMGIPNVGAGQIAITTACRAELHDGLGLRDRRPRDRRGVGDDPPQRRRHDGRRRSEAGVFEPFVGRLRLDAGAVPTNDDPRAPRGRSTSGRTGFVPGEGLRRARPRGARARPARACRSCRDRRLRRDRRRVAHHAPAPGGIGAVRAARRALAKAGLQPSDVAHVNAHATSTPEGDKAELQAIRTIFGDRAGEVSITANKSMLGHTLGAAGAIEAVVSILTIRDSCVPPTINLEDPDDEVGELDIVAGPCPRARTSASRSRTRSGSAARTRP
jgi:3-oxoacyl-[acyl-carrier-protein] synthase II